MQRVPVDSSDILSIGYDAATRMLEIEFHGGRLYHYRNVEPEIYEQLMRADSHGQYFNTFIHGRYRFERVGKNESTPEGKGLLFITDDAYAFACLELALQPFGIEADRRTVEIDEVRIDDPEMVATKKAKAAHRLLNQPVLVLAEAWNLLSLHGFPGTAMATVASQLDASDYLRLLEAKGDRTVSIVQALVYYDGARSKACLRTIFGVVGSSRDGEGMHSLDQLVTLTGQNKTVAATHDIMDTSFAARPDSVWQDFAKWYNLQRRIGRV